MPDDKENGRWKIAEVGMSILISVLLATFMFLWSNDQKLQDKLDKLQEQVSKLACKG